MRAKIVGALAIGWSLACSGLEMPNPEPAAPADPAVEELLAAEQGGEEPALEGDARTARAQALTAFLAATPDFADWKAATIDCLKAECEPTTEAAYGKAKADFAPKPPEPVAEVGDPWRALVIVDAAYWAGDDWDAAMDEMEEALPADQVATVEVGPGISAVSVQKDGAEVASIDLKPFVPERTPKLGYVVAQEGVAPRWIDPAPVADVTKAACDYFGIECAAAPGEPEPAEPAEEGPAKAKTKVKAKAKMKAKAGL